MISIQPLIYTALAGNAALGTYVGTRVYPDLAPQDVVRPFLVWQDISMQQMNDLSGSSETNGLNNYLIQVTTWSKTRTQARDVDSAVRTAMAAGAGFKSVMTGARSMSYEPDTKLFGMQSDFSVWLKT